MAVPINDPIQKGGYPPEIFVSANFDKKFLCKLCNRILKDPVQSYCGHRFCRSCFEGLISSNSLVHCQSCKEEGVGEEEYTVLTRDQMFPDNAVKREMGSMQTQCINKGCDWRGVFKVYEAHLAECKFKPVPCPKCGAALEATQVEFHMEKECEKRMVTCPHCKADICYADMEEHNKICPKFPLKCDDCGKKKIPRDKFQDHINKECTKQKVPCLPECGSISRETFPAHLDKKPGIHINAIMEKLNHFEIEIARRFDQITTDGGGQSAQQIAEIQQKLQHQQQAIQSIVSQGGGDGVGTVVSNQELGTLRTRCQTLELKTGTFEGIVTTLHREIERCITALETSERQQQAQKQTIEANERKIRTLEQTLSLKNVAMAELDLRIKTLELTNYDGTLIWKVTEWSKKRQDALSGNVTSIYSPIFYTSRNGYKMCARLYPNGDGMGKGTNLSIFFVVMRGNYDALLSWPFTHRVTFMLLDQNNREHVIDSFRPDPASSSFRRPTSEMNIASGCPLFMMLSKLDDPNLAYVKDDCMFIKIVVDLSESRRT